MSLCDLDIKIEYRSLVDNIAKDFYVPLLNEAISYKRAVGFFSSSILVEISKGIVGLVNNGGYIRLIASPYLSEEDVKAIHSGYERRAIIEKALLREMNEPQNKYQETRLNLLANLIADGILDIKIAVTETGSLTGMYHEKVGIIEDQEGNKVAFSGSMNESANALLANYETVDVFKSWDERDSERVQTKEEYFDRIWEGIDSTIRIFDAANINEKIIEKYKKSEVDYKKIDVSEDVVMGIDKDYSFFRVPANVDFHEYQKDAISNWISKSCFGILDMATGTGKTYTALGCLSKLSETLQENLAVVIIVPYQHLVEQWVEDIKRFNVNPIIAYSYPGANWRKEFSDAVQAYNVGALKHFCIIATNATFSLDDFQKILLQFKRNYCFVADEAHNVGAEKIRKLLPKKARYRLGLSATIERHRDDEGTNAIMKYFGPICLSYTLKDAIKNGFLTTYYYYPVVVYLDSEEYMRYAELTVKIKKASLFSEDPENDESLKELLIRRARIIAGCNNKVSKLLETIKDYKNDYNILVYCGATKYGARKEDESELRQIEEVNRRLYHELGMKVRKFTSNEDNEARTEIKEMFVNQEIQVITAIKCLDEGVNIPAIKTAFILASSTNPKEYIQRRGRVLRKADNKEYAIIYDFITLPRPLNDVKYLSYEEQQIDLSLVKREFSRIKEFASEARNPSDADQLQLDIMKAYQFNEITEG